MSQTIRKEPRGKNVELKALRGSKLIKKQRTKKQRRTSAKMSKDIEFATRHRANRHERQLNVSMYSEEE